MINKFLFLLAFWVPLASICLDDTPDTGYHIRLLMGDAIQEIIPFVITQRIDQYREYPYLYEGSIEEETESLRIFAQLPQSAVAVAYHEDKPVGFITGTPLIGYGHHFEGSIQAFENDGKNPKDYYYFADVLILPEHQGKSLATRLFEIFEAHCRNLGFPYISFVSESHAEHPLKPADYKEVDLIWQHFGYQKTNIVIYISWNTIQSNDPSQDQAHELPYWIKMLD